MATAIIPLIDWRALDKQSWHKLILRWNQRKGFTKKIPRPIGTMTAYLSPNEERQMVKRRKAERKKQTPYVSNLSWEEVPQRLPYVFGCQEAMLPEVKRRVKHPDLNMVYVDAGFWDMTKAATSSVSGPSPRQLPSRTYSAQQAPRPV
jgi:hypothetical protein